MILSICDICLCLLIKIGVIARRGAVRCRTCREYGEMRLTSVFREERRSFSHAVCHADISLLIQLSREREIFHWIKDDADVQKDSSNFRETGMIKAESKWDIGENMTLTEWKERSIRVLFHSLALFHLRSIKCDRGSCDSRSKFQE